jgi:hypothetical protein
MAARQNASEVMARWHTLTTEDLPALNEKLRAAGLPVLVLR